MDDTKYSSTKTIEGEDNETTTATAATTTLVSPPRQASLNQSTFTEWRVDPVRQSHRQPFFKIFFFFLLLRRLSCFLFSCFALRLLPRLLILGLPVPSFNSFLLLFLFVPSSFSAFLFLSAFFLFFLLLFWSLAGLIWRLTPKILFCPFCCFFTRVNYTLKTQSHHTHKISFRTQHKLMHISIHAHDTKMQSTHHPAYMTQKS